MKSSLRELFERLVRALERIAAALHCTDFRVAILTIQTEKGFLPMSASLVVGKTGTAVLHEFSNGTEFTPPGPVAYTSSDPTVATVDMASGLVTAVGPGTCTISGSDSGNGLSASDTLTVTAAPPVLSATLVITPN